MQKFFISEPFIASDETGGFINIGLEHSFNLVSVSFGGPHHYHTVSEAEAAAQTICDALNGEPAAVLSGTQPDRLTIAAMINLNDEDLGIEWAKLLMCATPPSGNDNMLYWAQAKAKYRLMLADALISQSQNTHS